jgi:carboxypeptidase PM20D1
MNACTPEQAQRLGRAIRYRTVTLASEDPSVEPGYDQFLGFEEFLRREFPRAASALHWEKLGELALLATWGPSADTPAAPGLLFYAHYDVVPSGDESAWTHPGFSGDCAEDFIWGRGTLDDKGTLLGLMEAVEALLAEGFQPARPLFIALGGDEETSGERGALVLARTLASRGVRLACVFDEGSVILDGFLSFVPGPIALIGLAEKGVITADLIVRGAPGHAAMPGRGTGPGALAAICAAIERNPFPLRLTSTVVRFFKAIAPHARGPVGLVLRFPRLMWPLLKIVAASDPTMDAMFRTTQALTMVRAGEKPNVIPDEARAIINMRLLPGDSPSSALARVERIARRHLPRAFSLIVRLLPGANASGAVPESPMDPRIWAALTAAIHAAEPRAVMAPFLVLMYTDSRNFASISDSIVRLMPVVLTPTDVARIHGVDERISMENYGRMIQIYTHLMRAASGREKT